MNHCHRAFAVLLFAGYASLIHAAPLETIKLEGKQEQGEIKGGLVGGNSQQYRLTTQSQRLLYTVDGTKGACAVEVQKNPQTGISKQISNFPSQQTTKTNKGDQFIFIFSQTREAWKSETPCQFSLFINP